MGQPTRPIRKPNPKETASFILSGGFGLDETIRQSVEQVLKLVPELAFEHEMVHQENHGQRDDLVLVLLDVWRHEPDRVKHFILLFNWCIHDIVWDSYDLAYGIL